jgi:hypothetical protein
MHSLPEIRTGDVDWSAWLTGAKDLEEVQRALSRERVIRDVMAQTGESRQVVADLVDVGRSMDHEAVLGLTEGEPTTLHDALSRYVDQLGQRVIEVEGEVHEAISADLDALLTYPWPGDDSLELQVEHSNDNSETLTIRLGGQEVYQGSAAREGGAVAEDVAGAVHRAVLERFS